MARVIREMSRQLWRPSIEADGITFQSLLQLVRPLHQWRDDFLVHVGVPSNFQADWDFVAAVSACTSDAQYHVMWVILHNAVEEFGIREINDAHSQDPTSTITPDILQIEELKSSIAKEAIHGAVRIAGLVSVSFGATNFAYSKTGASAHFKRLSKARSQCSTLCHLYRWNRSCKIRQGRSTALHCRLETVWLRV
jgi:hypothetical protein